MDLEIFSLGHSNLSFKHFHTLLEGAGVTAIADVRSSPYSRRTPWFSRQEFKVELKQVGVAYAFLGDQLGGRPQREDLFREGVADYVAMAATADFRAGLERLVRGAEKHRIAMVCMERDPLHCHRCLLVSRRLAILGFNTTHLHSDGLHESQKDAEERLLCEENLAYADLLFPASERLNEAYLRRNSKVGFSIKQLEPEEERWTTAS